MIAVDTNILVYAHRTDSEWHGPAKDCLRGLAEGRTAWAVPWPCIHEFLAIVTHPRIYEPSSTLEQAIDQVDAWMESPTLMVIGESEDHWAVLTTRLRKARVKGAMVHDGRVAAMCVAYGVSELLTADRDFARFPDVVTRNPLTERR